MKITSQLTLLTIKKILSPLNFAIIFLLFSVIYPINYSPDRLISSSFTLLLSYMLFLYHYKKYEYPSGYTNENSIIKGFEIRLINYNSRKDISALALLVAWVVFFSVINTLLYNGYRGYDSIGYLGYNEIALQMWGTRFTPFAHQEFSILPDNFYIIRALISLQFAACIYFLNKILPLKYFWQRALSIIIITLSPSFFFTYIHLICPDRNLLFFCILFLYNLLKFYKNQKLINLASALLFANIAIYYKEPFFGFLAVFAITSLIIKYFNKEFTFSGLLKKPILFIVKYPVEVWLLLSSAIFVLNYLLFTAPYDGPGYSKGAFDFNFLFQDLVNLMLTLIIIIYILNIKYKLIKNSFHLPLLMGGLAYLVLVISNISITIGTLYYKCIFDFAITLSLFFIISQIESYRKLKLFIAFVLIIITVNSIQLNFTLYKNITLNTEQSKYLINYFKNEKEDIRSTKKIFTNYSNGYLEKIFLAYISKSIPKDLIEYYSLNACEPYNYEKECNKGTLENNYDYAIIYREMISEKNFARLNKNFVLERISNYPKWLKAVNKDIFVIKGYNYRDGKGSFNGRPTGR